MKHDQAPGMLRGFWSGGTAGTLEVHRRFWSEAQCEAGRARYRLQGASCL